MMIGSSVSIIVAEIKALKLKNIKNSIQKWKISSTIKKRKKLNLSKKTIKIRQQLKKKLTESNEENNEHLWENKNQIQ